MNNTEIVNKYLNIVLVEGKNGEGLADILAEAFVFNDPFTAGISSAEEFINNPATRNWINTKKSFRIERRFEAGNEVCFLYTISVLAPNGETVDFEVADYFEFCDGKIAKERVYFFDPVRFAKAMGFFDVYMTQYSKLTNKK